MKTIQTLDNRPFKHLITTIGALPTSFIDSMSYYEMLAWLCDYLNNQVVPAVNNNAEAIQELQDYVEHYFDNLDVQEEIDNKLDEMAESGELAEIIAQYIQLNGVLAYDTIADMAAAENLVAGSIARVLGNSAYATGDGAYYRVRALVNTDTVDGFNLVALHDPTLVGERIHEVNTAKPINVLYYGVKGDGTTDNSTLIQKIIDDNPRAVIYFPSGNYLIKSGIKVKDKYPVSFKLENDAKLFTDTAITCLIDLGTDRDNNDHFDVETDSYRTIIEGGVIDCDKSRFQHQSDHCYLCQFLNQ